MKTFSTAERKIIEIIKKQGVFLYDGEKYGVKVVGKPVVPYGEPKTDIYLFATCLSNPEKAFERKISFKKDNFDFIENKISASRAREILGDGWKDIIINSLLQIKEKLLERKLIFKSQSRKTEEGSFTLGWKFELLNKASGNLSGIIKLSDKQAYNIYSGDCFLSDKRDAKVGDNTIPESGVADTILLEGNYECIEDIIANLIDIKVYAKEHNKIYFACKALNYRSFEKKYDGNRPLAVFVDWRVKNNKLIGELVFDDPLDHTGTIVYNQLCECLRELNIYTTDDITGLNTDQNIVFGI